MAEGHPGAGLGDLGGPSMNGSSAPVIDNHVRPPEPRELSEPSIAHDSRQMTEEPVGADRAPAGTSGELPAEPEEPALEVSGSADGAADPLSETDWETTRYLAVETQLNLRYARLWLTRSSGSHSGRLPRQQARTWWL